MPEKLSDNKRIAKNTLMLYIRMLLMMAITLYTSRVVLATLGVEDFGIYNVVGGFVTMFSMISGAMTTATQRFLSFAIGKRKEGEITEVFSTAVLIHIVIGLIVILVGETLGVWFINTQMNFHANRYEAAMWVFEFSLFTFLIKVLCVPYNAAIVAYEKMSAFAYISLIEVVLNLLIVFLIKVSPFDKLVFYAFLMAIVSIVICITYGLYSSRNIKDCYCTWRFNKKIYKEIASFVSWNLIGSLADVLKNQGLDVVLNIFFGPAINAARGIAMQVNSALNKFVSSFQMAMNPQIVKLYAAGEKDKMFNLVLRGSRLSFLLLMTISLPVMIEAPFLLRLWLVKVPDSTVIFLRIVILISLIDSLSNTLITSMHASGKVRDYQIVVGGLSLLTLPLAYALLKMGLASYYAFVAALIISIICHFARLILLEKSIQFPIMHFLLKVTLRVFLITIIAYILPFISYLSIRQNWYNSILLIFISLGSGTLVSFFLGLDYNEKSLIFSKINSISKKIHL